MDTAAQPLPADLWPSFTPCPFCDLPAAPPALSTFSTTTCGACLASTYADELEFAMTHGTTLLELQAKRSRLLAELSETDAAMRALPPPPRAATTPQPRSYLCTCGLEFTSYIDRAVHFDTYESDAHRDDGERTAGKPRYSSNPRRETPAKPTPSNTILNFDDLAD